MQQAHLLAAWFGHYYLAARQRVRGTESDRGDVPGWVMITVMSAGLVVIIFSVFKSKIDDAISNAISSVVDGTSGN